MKRLLLPLVAVLCFGAANATAQKPPDTVFLEDLTWEEVRALIQAGKTSVIIGTAGTEQKGPHMVDGEHKFVMEWSADKIARGMGKTLVAPVVTYVPEGSWENIGGHMAKPGTITLPDDRFTLTALIVLLLVKASIWSVALGSGTSGGVLAPLLIIGGALGAIVGHIFPRPMHRCFLCWA